MYCTSNTNLLSAPGHVAQEQNGVHTSAVWIGSMHTTPLHTALHYTTLHIFLMFAPVKYAHCHEHKRGTTVITSVVSNWSMWRLHMAVIWTRPKPVQTWTAKCNSSSPDTDKIWVGRPENLSFFAGRKISLFILTPTATQIVAHQPSYASRLPASVAKHALRLLPKAKERWSPTPTRRPRFTVSYAVSYCIKYTFPFQPF
jgi:hypothetical protein